MYNTEDTLRRVYVNDIAALYCKYNRNFNAELFQELAGLNICLLDNYRSQTYEWRDFLDSDSLYELDILQKMQYDIEEIYDVFGKLKEDEYILYNSWW